MKTGKRYRKKRREKQLYYGMALLVMLFIIVGLTSAVKGRDQRELPVNKEIKEEKQTSGGDTKENPVSEQESEDKRKKEAENPNIRVLLMTNGFRNTVHPEIKLSADVEMIVTYGKEYEKKKVYKKGKTLTIRPDHKWFQQGNIRMKAVDGKIKIKSIERGDGTPSYAGVIELRTTSEGIVVINELPVESYLCGVVPSEMPASYKLEALKAQAVCARSYAYRQMEDYGYPEYKAHVNDSTDYQVYNNSGQAERSSKAVEETKGEAVRYKGKVVPTYYYSTSCGNTTTMEAWGTKPNESNGYLYSAEVKGKNGDYEKNLPWYRWTASVAVKTISNLIGLNTGKDIGTVKSIEVTKRGPGDVAVEMKAVGDKGSVTVKTENKIRSALGGSGYQIKLNDGSKTESRDLLPSAFFSVEKKGEKFVIKGGGFGHGIGMSQTGANEMAKQGKDYKEILSMFYHDISVK